MDGECSVCTIAVFQKGSEQTSLPKSVQRTDGSRRKQTPRQASPMSSDVDSSASESDEEPVSSKKVISVAHIMSRVQMACNHKYC